MSYLQKQLAMYDVHMTRSYEYPCIALDRVRMSLILDKATYTQLIQLADRERREPRAQAVLLVERALRELVQLNQINNEVKFDEPHAA